MEWHRNHSGGYAGEHTDGDADATIVRSAGGWTVTTNVFGGVVDVKEFRLLADAKWHASAVASVCMVGARA